MDLTFTEFDSYYDELNNTTNTLDDTFYNDNNFINNINNNTNNIIVSKKPQYNPFKRQTQVPQQKNHSKKTQISYDDILSSMNTVVIDGKLEFIRNDRNDKLQNIIENQPQQKKVTFSGSQLQPQNNYQTQINKSSYIYNKFFKDYKEPSQPQNEEPRRPLTKKEFIKQLIINRANAINERNRIAEIKSTKLLFNNNNNRNIIINSRNIPNANGANGMNHLFKFK